MATRILVDALVSYPGTAREPAARRIFGDGKESCHLTVDGPIELLHEFAAKIGMRRTWFQPARSLGHGGDHYDLTPSRRASAVRLGAIEVSGRELARMRRAARHDGVECEERGCVVPRDHADDHRGAYGATWPRVSR